MGAFVLTVLDVIALKSVSPNFFPDVRCVISSLLIAACLLAADPVPTFSAQGNGSASAKPDTGYFTVGVVTRNENPSAAIKENNAAAERVLKILAEQKIPAEDIQTTDFSINPQYKYDNRGENPQLLGYTVTNQVNVTVCDFQNFGRVLDAVVAAGANNVQNVRFGVKNPEPLYAEARKQAFAKAKEKAKETASLAGVRLGKIRGIHEGLQHRPYPQYEAALRTADSPGRVPVSGGQLTFTVSVSLDYEFSAE